LRYASRLKPLFFRRIQMSRLDRTVSAGKVPFMSPGVVTSGDAALGFGEGLTVRDPDGHVMQLIQD
jgi:hypothetical protein